jgi:phosphate starvation-inducible PhoH-like protein
MVGSSTGQGKRNNRSNRRGGSHSGSDLFTEKFSPSTANPDFSDLTNGEHSDSAG